SNAPESVDLKTLARIASSRFNIEQCFEETKSETGLDEYETRSWVGWHRHITLSMMAHAWLASMTLKKKPRKLSKPDCPGDKTVAGNYFANSASTLITERQVVQALKLREGDPGYKCT
ncbi:MAG: hypothetical protein WA705_29440, partial [Candidatus Ozemobacteraceae bacterium]